MNAAVDSINVKNLLRVLNGAPEITLEFCLAMRNKRLQYRITQADLAVVAGYSAPTVSYWEHATLRRGQYISVPLKSARDWIMALAILVQEVRSERRPPGRGRTHCKRRPSI